MKISANSIITLFLSVYFFISFGALLGSIYLIWLTAYGVGWGGGEIGILELVWAWRGVVALFFFSTMAFIGLLKPRKIGLYFGYTISIAFIILMIIAEFDRIEYKIENNQTLSFQYIMESFLSFLFRIGLAIFSVIGLNKIREKFFTFRHVDFIFSAILTTTLFLAWHCMFPH